MALNHSNSGNLEQLALKGLMRQKWHHFYVIFIFHVFSPTQLAGVLHRHTRLYAFVHDRRRHDNAITVQSGDAVISSKLGWRSWPIVNSFQCWWAWSTQHWTLLHVTWHHFDQSYSLIIWHTTNGYGYYTVGINVMAVLNFGCNIQLHDQWMQVHSWYSNLIILDYLKFT